MSSSGQRLCAKHRVPLTTQTGYGMDEYAVIELLPSIERLKRRYPNLSDLSDAPSIGYTTRKTELYCPMCNASLQRDLR